MKKTFAIKFCLVLVCGLLGCVSSVLASFNQPIIIPSALDEGFSAMEWVQNENQQTVVWTSQMRIMKPQSIMFFIPTSKTVWHVEVSEDGSSWQLIEATTAEMIEEKDVVRIRVNLPDYPDVYIRVRYDLGSGLATGEPREVFVPEEIPQSYS